MSGFNTEIKRLGATFHVQTQDLGSSARSVESLIYKSGKLLSSRKADYTSALGNPRLADKIQRIMEEQHAAILEEIAAGRYDHFLTPEEKQSLPDKD